MRVLVVLNAADGGATLSALSLMEGLRSRGAAVFAALPPGGTPAARARLQAVAVRILEVELPWWNRNYKAKTWKRPLLAARELALSGAHVGTVARLVQFCRANAIDVVHTNTSLTLDPAVAARLSGAKHVWHVREQMGHGQLFRYWLPERALAASFLALSDAVITNSEESAGLFARAGVRDRVSVVHNGVDVEKFMPGAGAALRQRFGASRGDVVVGIVAHMTSRMKRHDVFVRAAAEALHRGAGDRVRFVVVGNDPAVEGGHHTAREYAEGVRAAARDAGVLERIIFAGRQDDVPAVMDAMDVLVHPSENESFGRVAVEAMAAGRPVVAARSGGLQEIVEDGVTGRLAEPGNPVAFTDALMPLLEDESLRTRMGTAGRARAHARFSSTAMVDGVVAAYARAGISP